MIDMMMVRQAAALVEDVRDSDPQDQVERLAAWARVEPRRIAELAVTVATLARGDAHDPGAILDLLDRLGVDVSKVCAQAHAAYNRLQLRRKTHEAPVWVRSGERIYQRTKSRRQRAVRKGVA